MNRDEAIISNFEGLLLYYMATNQDLAATVKNYQITYEKLESDYWEVIGESQLKDKQLELKDAEIVKLEAQLVERDLRIKEMFDKLPKKTCRETYGAEIHYCGLEENHKGDHRCFLDHFDDLEDYCTHTWKSN